MHLLNSFIFLILLIYHKVGAENLGKDDSRKITVISATTLPIVLQLSQSQKLVDHEISQFIKNETGVVMEKHMNHQHRHMNHQHNDIEVFNEKEGPQMEKQDEEPLEEAEVQEEANPEAEEAKEEEAEPDAEEEVQPAAEPADEPEAEDVPVEPKAEEQPADEPQPEPEPEVEEEPVEQPEPEPEHEAAAEEKTENVAPPPDEILNTAEAAADNDEAEMPNDEPAKGENELPVSHVAEDVTKTIATKVEENQEISCFTCTSTEELKCHIKPTKQMPCPKASEGDAGKHNGCYTLYQVDTNTTMRGCVDELAEEGLKYCLTNDKLCKLCYKNACNNKEAPSKAANMLQFQIFKILFYNIFSITIVNTYIYVYLI